MSQHQPGNQVLRRALVFSEREGPFDGPLVFQPAATQKTDEKWSGFLKQLIFAGATNIV